MTEISLSAEFDLSIRDPGIEGRFLAWVKENEQIDEMSGYPVVGRFPEANHWDDEEVHSYQAGLWLVGVPQKRTLFRPELEGAVLWVHIYSNVPMQVFYKDFPDFLKAIGVEKFEMRIPRYVECIKQAVEFLERGEVE
jgi:hypothetical protein